MNWAEQRRADRAAERADARLDLAAAAERRRLDLAAAAERKRHDQDAAEKLRGDREAEAAKTRDRRREWRRGHAVELLVYPLALVSAAMAIPAMAEYGYDLYGGVTGVALPALSELGMWAFAVALMVSRRRHPDRPTVPLTAGIAVFAAVGFVLNFAHGLDKGGVATAVVMAVVSVSGVVAHQLAVAAPPRSRAERAERRLARQAVRRVVRARRLAARRAVVELDADGTARLVHAPGLYVTRRRRLDPATVPGLPVADPWDAALAGLLGSGPDRQDPDGGTAGGPVPIEPGGSGNGGVALDPPQRPDRAADRPDPIESTPSVRSTRSTRSARSSRSTRSASVDPQGRREQDRRLAEARKLARQNGGPVSAEHLRTALRIAPKAARALRDQVNAELYGEAGS